MSVAQSNKLNDSMKRGSNTPVKESSIISGSTGPANSSIRPESASGKKFSAISESYRPFSFLQNHIDTFAERRKCQNLYQDPVACVQYQEEPQKYGFGQTLMFESELPVKDVLLAPVFEVPSTSNERKVTIMGSGDIAGACAFFLFTKGIASEIVLFDCENTIDDECTCAENDSVALGSECTCIKSNSVALGSQCTCIKSNSVALGSQCTCIKSNSVALGSQCTCIENDSVALGSECTCIEEVTDELSDECRCLDPIPLPLQRLNAIVTDLESASIFYDNRPTLKPTMELSDTDGSQVYIVTPDFGCMVLQDFRIRRFCVDIEKNNFNINVLKKSLAHITSTSKPDSVMLNMAQPAHTMSYAIWKLTGFDSFRVIGLGNSVGESYFRGWLSRNVEVDPHECQALISGGIGDLSVPIINTMSVCGAKMAANPNFLRDKCNPDFQYKSEEALEHATNFDKAIMRRRGKEMKQKFPSIWGASYIASKLTNAVINNTMENYTVEVFVKGCRHGSDRHVFLSLPCTIGRRGVVKIVKTSMTDDEIHDMQKCARVVFLQSAGADLPE